MIKTVLKILGIVLLVIFQIALFNKFSVWNAIPNFIIVLALSLLFKGRSFDGFLIAGVGGLLLDLGSPIRFGAYTFLFMLVAIICNFYILKIVPTPRLGTSFLIFSFCLLFIDLGLFVFIFHWPFWEVLPWAIIGGFWGMLVYYLVGKFLPPAEEIRLA